MFGSIMFTIMNVSITNDYPFHLPYLIINLTGFLWRSATFPSSFTCRRWRLIKVIYPLTSLRPTIPWFQSSLLLYLSYQTYALCFRCALLCCPVLCFVSSNRSQHTRDNADRLYCLRVLHLCGRFMGRFQIPCSVLDEIRILIAITIPIHRVAWVDGSEVEVRDKTIRPLSPGEGVLQFYAGLIVKGA